VHRHNQIWGQSQQLCAERPDAFRLICRVSVIDPDILFLNPPESSEFLPESRYLNSGFWITLRKSDHYPDTPLFSLLLRARRKRPSCRAAEQRDELAAFHSITSSASASSLSGIWRPSDLAVLRLMTSSNLVGCSTGRFAGFAPLKILSM